MSRISSIRQKDTCRWSDPILRRRKATASGDSDSSATSYSETGLTPLSKTYPPPPPPPPPSSTLLGVPPQDCPGLTGCWCHRKCQESQHHHRSRNSLLMPTRHSGSRREASQAYIVQRLSTKISEYKGQDLEEMAHYNSLKTSLGRIKSALDFVVHYAKCLELQHSTNLRLHRLVSSIVPSPTDRLVDLLNASSRGNEHHSEEVNVNILKNVIEQAALSLDECARLKTLKDDFKTKANDFTLATTNFNLVLTNLKVMSGQLRKIESQYDDIFFSYRQSRTALEREMVKVTGVLRESLSLCFNGLVKWLDYIGRNYSHLVELFSCLEEEVRSSSPRESISPLQQSVGTLTEQNTMTHIPTSSGDTTVASVCVCSSCPEHNGTNTIFSSPSQTRPR